MYITSILPGASAEELKRVLAKEFSRFGEIDSLRVLEPKKHRNHAGESETHRCAFVNFGSVAAAEAAVAELGQRYELTFAKPTRKLPKPDAKVAAPSPAADAAPAAAAPPPEPPQPPRDEPRGPPPRYDEYDRRGPPRDDYYERRGPPPPRYYDRYDDRRGPPPPRYDDRYDRGPPPRYEDRGGYDRGGYYGRAAAAVGRRARRAASVPGRGAPGRRRGGRRP